MKNILQKVNSIMKDVDYIQKDATNKFQNYDYASERAIKEKLHVALTKHGVVFNIETANPRVENGVLWIDCIYHFRDVESGEEISGAFIGSGQSRDEKGNYAAVTGAIKYILTSTFLIPTGDDPEDDEAKEPKATTASPQPIPKNPTQPTKLASTAQLKLINSRTTELGMKIEETKKLVSDLIGRKVESSKELTSEEASKIIEQLLPKSDGPFKGNEHNQKDQEVITDEALDRVFGKDTPS